MQAVELSLGEPAPYLGPVGLVCEVKTTMNWHGVLDEGIGCHRVLVVLLVDR